MRFLVYVCSYLSDVRSMDMFPNSPIELIPLRVQRITLATAQLEIVWPCALYILLKTKHKSFYTEEMCNLSNSYALENALYCRGVVVFCSLRYPIFFGPSESAFAGCAGVYTFFLWPELPIYAIWSEIVA